jgi:hypothetical protein
MPEALEAAVAQPGGQAVVVVAVVLESMVQALLAELVEWEFYFP